MRVWYTCANVMIPARIVALGAFQHAVVHEIGSRLHDSFRRMLLMNFHMSRALWTRRLELSRYWLGLFLKSLRLAPRGSWYGALPGTLDRRILPLLRLLLGRLNCDDSRSRLTCFFWCRNRLPYRPREEGHGADRSEYNKF